MKSNSENLLSFLLDHSAGSLSPSMALLGDVQARINPRARQMRELWDVAGGVMLESVPFGLERSRKRRGASNKSALQVTDIEAVMSSGPNWKRALGGIDVCPLPMPDLRLIRMKAGRKAPRHGHSNRDVTLVLEGAFRDEFGVYQRGDIAFAEPGQHHRPEVVGDKDCICLVAKEPGRFQLPWPFG
jgi:putative transcriptional regulator